MAAAALVASSGGGGGGRGEEDMEIYLRTIAEDGYFWSRLNTGTTEENVVLNPIESPHKFRYRSSIAAVGSTIYDIGGSSEACHSYTGEVYADVYYLDTTTRHGGTAWKKAPPMTMNRRRPYLVPLHDGRLLVVGGSNWFYEISPFAEIYNPNTRTWTPCKTIPDPDTIPFSFNGHIIVGNKIFLYSDGVTSLCCYDIREDCWEVCCTELEGRLGSSALVDGILYIVDYDYRKGNQFLFGYDFKNLNSLASKNENEKKQNPFALYYQMPVEILPGDGNKEDMAPIKWLPQMDKDFSIAFLWALGNDKLAMVWSPENGKVGRDRAAVYVSVFQMTKMNSGNDKPKNFVAAARPLYQRRYIVQGSWLLDCVVVSSSRKGEAHKDLPRDNNVDSNRHNMKQLDEKKRGKKKKRNKKKLNHK